MSSPNQELPDASIQPARDQQSAWRRHVSWWILLVLGALAVVVALIAWPLARTGVFPANRSASRTVVPANWQTFNDTLGLYTLRLPPEWMGYNMSGNGTMSNSFGSEPTFTEQFTFDDVYGEAGDPQIDIISIPIKNLDSALTHHLFCPLPKFNSTFHGIPAYHQVFPALVLGASDWIFETRNAGFTIQVSPQPHLVPLGRNAPTPTPLPAARTAADQADVNVILASFQPTDPKPLGC